MNPDPNRAYILIEEIYNKYNELVNYIVFWKVICAMKQ